MTKDRMGDSFIHSTDIYKAPCRVINTVLEVVAAEVNQTGGFSELTELAFCWGQTGTKHEVQKRPSSLPDCHTSLQPSLPLV